MVPKSAPVSSCQFPGVGKQGGGQKRPLSVKVELQHLGQVQKLVATEEGPRALSAVIQATWAILLRCYTGLDDVCFGFEEIGSSSAHTGSPEDSEIPVSAAVMHMHGDMSFGQLLTHAHDADTIVPITSDNTLQYNTSIFMRFGSHATISSKKQPPSKTVMMSEKVYSLYN